MLQMLINQWSNGDVLFSLLCPSYLCTFYGMDELNTMYSCCIIKGSIFAQLKGTSHMITQFPCLPGSPASPWRPLWPYRWTSQSKNRLNMSHHYLLFFTVLTSTFGPGGPWMPGCPCIHLQDALPAARPISAYPPHCHGHKGKTIYMMYHWQRTSHHVDLDQTYHTGELTASLWVNLLWVTGHFHLLEIHLKEDKSLKS